jgi:sugar diacid utilization regulator
LDGLLEHAYPSSKDVELARTIGRSRADLEIPLPEVIDAYHIAYRETWRELLQMAELESVNQTNELLADVTLLWTWLHRLSAAVADAHAEQTSVQAATRASLRRRLLDMLSDRGVSENEGRDLAQALGFDPDGRFTVIFVGPIGETQLENLASKLSSPKTLVTACYDATRHVLVAQGYAEKVLADSIRRLMPEVTLGIGMSRDGLPGARLSLVDAQDAFARACVAGRDIWFVDDWLLCVLTPVRDRLAPMLSNAVDVATEHPEWAETVRAYAGARSSVTGAAHTLSIHPNSAKYRLERWRTFTGWDPESFGGLAASLIALSLTDPGSASSLTEMPRQSEGPHE